MTAENMAAVLWDMDGTLIDSEPLWLETELAMLDRYGIEMTEQTHRRLIGSGLWDAAEHFRELGVPLETNEIVAEWVAHVNQGLRLGDIQWRPGARELLEDLAHHSVPCALVTMSVRSLAEAVVSQLPEGSFQCIIAGDEVTHEKPHPEPYLRAARELGVHASTCIAIEDSPTGLASASQAGTLAVGVPNLLSLDEAPHNAIIESLADVDFAALSRLYREHRSTSHHQDHAQEASQ